MTKNDPEDEVMHYPTIEDRNDQRIGPFVRLRQSVLDETLGRGYFIAETYRVVQLLIQSGIEVQSIFGAPKWLEKLEPEIQRYGVSRERVLCANQGLMESIVGFSLHQGVMAVGKVPVSSDVDELDDRIVALNGVVNPENVGSIVRASVALGLNSYIRDRDSADPYIRRAVRVSMGNVFQTRVHRTQNLLETFRFLKERGYRIIGSDARKTTHRLQNYLFPKKYALVIGSEVSGMDPEVHAACDDVLFIPTRESHAALNASHAAAILFYAAGSHNQASGK